ncbi:MFS transporter [Citrobacter youngae]|uniref:Transporter, major facilitator family protein n=1 Tax=Citrobacter youngae ATCC 29220 TaxID=500640 RepID=D4BDK6_9ENTR|nr:MFS transporter [Citrobacter youngae]EFE08055.1 transporter, major facilitator family protein [Citrobacter youngae ATCC 29220]
MSTLVLNTCDSAADTSISPAQLVARIERLPVTRKLIFIRIVTGISTFFDSYTVLAIAFAMPELIAEWHLTPFFVGLIIAASYAGQLVGAIAFGSLAEKIGRLSVLKITILMFVTMSAACLFSWNGWSLMAIRFLQGIGIGAEVPVASAYINEFIGSKKRGRFFLLYEVIFPVGLMFAGIAGYFLVPMYGWKAMFWVGLIPPLIAMPLRWLMPESPRWLISKGRMSEANQVISSLEHEVIRSGRVLDTPQITVFSFPANKGKGGWKELFSGIYLKRTLMLWGLWLSAYLVNNGMITWLPTLYRSAFHLSVPQSLVYGWITSAAGVVASVTCALLIDKVGRKRWYSAAFCLAALALGILGLSGASGAFQVLIFASLAYAIMQTVTFSLYLYSAELYPTRLRTIGTGLGSAWLRAGSSLGTLLVGVIVAHYGVRYVFDLFGIIALSGGVITILFAIETKDAILEVLSP